MTTTFIVTAGGLGKRMGSDLPKQFIEINGKPILMHTLQKLHAFDSKAQFILTLPSEWVEYWKSLQKRHEFHVDIQLVEGGKERFHSIKNALKLATGEVIAIHDGVRPLVSVQTLQGLIDGISKFDAVIPIVGIKESVRLMGENNSEPINRDLLRIVQTPQVFKKELINRAYEVEFTEKFTDDASVVEKLGVSIQLIQGNEENIKITSPIDLKIAEHIISKPH
jgi:2-C-methyl-D-erythritol 4-phosphate cytidylyltransferase